MVLWKLALLTFCQAKINRMLIWLLGLALGLILLCRSLQHMVRLLPQHDIGDMSSIVLTGLYLICSITVVAMVITVALFIVYEARSERSYIALNLCMGYRAGQIQVLEMAQYGMILFLSLGLSRIIGYALTMVFSLVMGIAPSLSFFLDTKNFA